MSDTFSRFHPVVNFTFFVSVIGYSMFIMNPVFLCIAFLCAMGYSIYLGKKTKAALKFNVIYMLPLMLFMALINPLFNHSGTTILLYVNDNPITLEALAYGFICSMMFLTVIMWFSCYNIIMTSDKFIYIFGRVIPALSLIFSMVLRFVPKYKVHLKVVSNAQKCTGRDMKQGSLITRAKNGTKILSIMTTWALENAIETADSMKSRGYGLKGRTSYSNFSFKLNDKLTLLVISILDILIFTASTKKLFYASYIPKIQLSEFNFTSFLAYLAFLLLCILPLIVDFMEEVKWHYLKSKV